MVLFHCFDATINRRWWLTRSGDHHASKDTWLNVHATWKDTWLNVHAAWKDTWLNCSCLKSPYSSYVKKGKTTSRANQLNPFCLYVSDWLLWPTSSLHLETSMRNSALCLCLATLISLLSQTHGYVPHDDYSHPRAAHLEAEEYPREGYF